MRKNKSDSYLIEEIQKEIQSSSDAKDRMMFLDGPTSVRNYENSQLLLRYKPFKEAYTELNQNNNLSDKDLKKLLAQFNSSELFEEVKEFVETGSLYYRPKSKRLKVITNGRNAREGWISFQIFGIFEQYVLGSLSEFLGFSTSIDGTDPSIEPANIPPADFPEAEFSVNFLKEERAIEIFYRSKHETYFRGKTDAIAETILILAKSFFNDYEPIPGLDRKLKLLDKYSEKSTLLINETIDCASGEKIKHSAIAPIYEMLESDSESLEEDEEIDDRADREYALLRQYKSEINIIQKKRFVKKV